MIALLATIATAQEFSWSVPEIPQPVANECPAAVDLVVGQPLPAGLVDSQGRVTCYATVVPTSDLAGLLLTESWALQARPRGERLELELDWEQERYRRLVDEFEKPTPWLQRPGTQRTLGRVETVAVMALAVGLYAVLDSQVVR